MKNRKSTISGLFICFAVIFFACGEKKKTVRETSFTKVDSVTERYLELQDSMLIAWNMMINDDNRKFRCLHKLLDELMSDDQYDKDALITLELRLEQLAGHSFTQETINNAELIEEYDFTTNSLVSEVISLAEGNAGFAHDNALRKMVEEIKLTDQRVDKNRLNYDAITYKYNRFLEKNKPLVREIDEDISLEKKPLFQMVAEE